ncbi:MAG TPA: hypothetical protein VHZ50_12520 [Puia sp.]|nr:hypothetical protein [Puia sp.]
MSKNNKPANTSRREFLLKGSMASMSLFMVGSVAQAKSFLNYFGEKPNSKFFGVQIGVITYSFRSMPGSIEQILQYCVDSNINAIELIGDAAEEYAGKPINPRKNGTAHSGTTYAVNG